MDKKEYKFSNGLECFQEELTLGQDVRITKLFSKIDLQNFAETRIIDLIGIITKENIVLDFLRIVLQNNTEIPYEQFLSLRNSELKEIVEDFFGLNPLVRDALGIFKNAAGILNTNTTSSSSEENVQSSHQDS